MKTAVETSWLKLTKEFKLCNVNGDLVTSYPAQPVAYRNLSSFREEVIIVILMRYNTQLEAAVKLKASTYALSKYINARGLDYKAVKIIQMMEGVARRNVGKINLPDHIRSLFGKKENILAAYQKILTSFDHPLKSNGSKLDFFFFTCAIAAVLGSDTAEIAAEKLGISCEQLANFFKKKNSNFQSIKALYTETQSIASTPFTAPSVDPVNDPNVTISESQTSIPPDSSPNVYLIEPLSSPWDMSEKEIQRMKRVVTETSIISWCTLFEVSTSIDDIALEPTHKRTRHDEVSL